MNVEILLYIINTVILRKIEGKMLLFRIGFLGYFQTSCEKFLFDLVHYEC